MAVKLSELTAPNVAMGAPMSLIAQRGRDRTLRGTVGRRIAILGDSLAAYNTYTAATETSHTPNGPIAALQSYWGHRFYFDPALNKGVGGNTTAQMLARYDDDIAANYANFDYLVLNGGTNDASAGTAPAVSFANLMEICNRATDNGKPVALIGPWPRSDVSWNTASGKRLIQLRDLLMNACYKTTRPIYLIDAWPSLANPTSSSSDPITSPIRVLADLTHGASGGMMHCFAPVAARALSFIPPRPSRMAGAADVYDATDNPYGNLLTNASFLTTTGGSKDADVGGTVQSSWQAKDRGGSFTSSEVVVSTKTGIPCIDAIPGNYAVITCNIASVKTSNEIVGFKQDISVAGKWAAGDLIEAGMVVYAENVANLKSLSCSLVDSDGSTQYFWKDGPTQISLNNFCYPESQCWHLQPPIATIRANPSTLSLEFQAAFDASSANASATFYIGAPFVRKFYSY